MTNERLGGIAVRFLLIPLLMAFSGFGIYILARHFQMRAEALELGFHNTSIQSEVLYNSLGFGAAVTTLGLGLLYLTIRRVRRVDELFA